MHSGLFASITAFVFYGRKNANNSGKHQNPKQFQKKFKKLSTAIQELSKLL